MYVMDIDKTYREKPWRQLYNNAASFNKQTLEAKSYQAATMRPHPSHL